MFDTIENKLFNFFLAIINENTTELQAVQSQSYQEITLKGTQLIFTISGLYHRVDNTGHYSYTQFRQQLYQSRINARLTELGYKIDIYHSTNKVDTTWYQLKRL